MFTLTKRENTKNKLIEQVKKVLEYSQNTREMATSDGVKKLIDKFYSNKLAFFSLFPQSNDEDMINLSYTLPEKIEIDLPCKPLYREFLKKLAKYATNFVEPIKFTDLDDFIKEQGADNFFLNRVGSDYIYGEKIIKKDMKISKAFKYFVSQDELLRSIQDLMSEYIQKKKMTGYLTISAHPLDFLSSSMNNYNWRSCHSLDGDFRAGNLSYMTDSCTLICYLTAEKDQNRKIPMFPFDWNDKKWRMLIHVSYYKTMIFFGRHYPMDLPVINEIILEEIGKLLLENNSRGFWFEPEYNTYKWQYSNDGYITSVTTNTGENIELPKEDRSKFFSLDNSWVTPTKDLFKEPDESLHYNDILYSTVYLQPYYGVLMEVNKATSEERVYDLDQKFFMGETVYCPWCGNEILTTDQGMMCYNCRQTYCYNQEDGD